MLSVQLPQVSRHCTWDFFNAVESLDILSLSKEKYGSHWEPGWVNTRGRLKTCNVDPKMVIWTYFLSGPRVITWKGNCRGTLEVNETINMCKVYVARYLYHSNFWILIHGYVCADFNCHFHFFCQLPLVLAIEIKLLHNYL